MCVRVFDSCDESRYKSKSYLFQAVNEAMEGTLSTEEDVEEHPTSVVEAQVSTTVLMDWVQTEECCDLINRHGLIVFGSVK